MSVVADEDGGGFIRNRRLSQYFAGLVGNDRGKTTGGLHFAERYGGEGLLGFEVNGTRDERTHLMALETRDGRDIGAGRAAQLGVLNISAKEPAIVLKTDGSMY